MLSIEAFNLSKRFGTKKIVSDFSHRFESKNKIAFIGSNGSGKSTLLKILLTYMQPDKGKIVYNYKEKEIELENIFRLVSLCAPYQQLPEELNTKQLYRLASHSRKFVISEQDFFDLACAQKSDVEKPIRLFSSGMKQRLKLSLAFGVDGQAVFLDEPTANLDNKNISWYYSNFKVFAEQRLVFLASNQHDEYKNFDSVIDLDKISLLNLN